MAAQFQQHPAPDHRGPVYRLIGGLKGGSAHLHMQQIAVQPVFGHPVDERFGLRFKGFLRETVSTIHDPPLFKGRRFGIPSFRHRGIPDKRHRLPSQAGESPGAAPALQKIVHRIQCRARLAARQHCRILPGCHYKAIRSRMLTGGFSSHSHSAPVETTDIHAGALLLAARHLRLGHQAQVLCQFLRRKGINRTLLMHNTAQGPPVFQDFHQIHLLKNSADPVVVSGPAPAVMHM